MVHEPLENPLGCIRVVTIQPGQGTSQIVCSLQTVRLEDAQYEALSYCWGDENDVKNICLNSIQWPVTSNLYAALEALRQSTDPRTLWIDAVCINQNDQEEKSLQVEIMGDIYSSAQRTIAWIGPSNDNTAHAFSFLEFVQEFVVDEDVEDFLNDPDSCGALLDIFQRPYWYRLWVVQEFILSHQVLVQCGSSTLSGECIGSFLASDLCRDLRDQKDQLNPSLLQILGFRASPYGMISALGALFNVQRGIGPELNLEDYKTISFYELLHATQCHHCKDPRDKLYAIVGLAKFHPQDQNLGIRPDYSLSTLDVYRNFTVEHIKTSKSLMMLEKAGLQRRGMHEISWLPDFTVNGWPARYIGVEGIYNACGNLEPTCNFNDNTLFTRGLQCDRIRRKLSLDGIQGFIPRIRAVLDLIISTGNDKPLQTLFNLMFDFDSDPNFVMPLAVGFCFLLGQIAMGPGDFADIPPNIFLEWYNLYSKKWDPRDRTPVSERLDAFLEDFPSFQTIPDWPLRIIDEEENIRNLQRFKEESRMDKSNFQPFLTLNGLVGCSGEEVAIGDHVFVLAGGSNPFVLRGKGTSYSLVDYCFVDGMMHGEMIKNMEQGALQMQEIAIV